MNPAYRDGQAPKGEPVTYYSYEAKLRRNPLDRRILIAGVAITIGSFVRVVLPQLVERFLPDYTWLGVLVAWLALGVAVALGLVSARMSESTSSEDFRTTK